MVELFLAKEGTRVRFPLAAPKENTHNWVFSFGKTGFPIDLWNLVISLLLLGPLVFVPGFHGLISFHLPLMFLTIWHF